MIDTILLAAVVVELAVPIALNLRRPASSGDRTRPESAVTPPAPAPEPAWDDLEALERDLHVEALIQVVDPTWALGDDRDHIALIPGTDGHIEKAELR